MLEPLPNIDPNQPIAVDVETCDPELKFSAPGFISKVGFVAGIAVAVKDASYYIPINHKKGENYDQEEVVEWLNKILSGNTEKIFHNAQYDVGWLNYIGVKLHGRLFDTMLAAPLLNENRFAYTLDSLGKIYCGEGKFEEALKMAVADEFNKVRTRKTIIRLKENSPCNGYKPFDEAKMRVTQHYELWPDEVKSRYTVVGHEKSKSGQEIFLVPHKRQNDIKGLLWACDPEAMGTYPIQDVELTFRLYEIFKEELEKENLTKLMALENDLIPVLLEMRLYGVRIDMPQAIVLDKKYTAELNKLQKHLNTLAGFEVDVNIDNDLIKICNKFHLKYAKTAKGNPSFKAEVVPKDDMGIFQTVLKIRNYMKARDTYIRGYIFGSTLDGWLHGQYNQLKSDDGGTITGRLSSSNPNMQNLPNPKSSQIGVDIRGLFLPDNKDEKWLSMDYSGQEPRMLVHTVLALQKQRETTKRGMFTEESELVPGVSIAMRPEFRGRQADFHTAVATICMEKEFEAEGKTPAPEELKAAAKAFRPKAKSIGLGVMYGSGARKVAEEMTKKGFPMSVEDATVVRNNLYEAVPFLKYLSDFLMTIAKTRGYILTILNRRGRFDLWECPVYDKEEAEVIGTSNYGFKSRQDALDWRNANIDEFKSIKPPQRAGTYKALNKYIQGSSADQTKTAMLHLYTKGDLSLNTLDIFYRRIPNYQPPKIKIQVHDEINMSITEKENIKQYQDLMEHCIPLMVEVVADPVVCNKWSEAK